LTKPYTREQAIQIIELFYRSLLGRASDPAGLASKAKLLEEGKMDESQIALTFLNSPEFKIKRGSALKNSENFNKSNIYTKFVTLETLGCKFILPHNSPAVRELQAPGGYERWVLPYFLEHCKPGSTVIDIGASWGVFALPAAKRVGSSGMVYAIEASAVNCKVIIQSAIASEIQNIEVLPFGVSDRLGNEQLKIQTVTNNNAIKSHQKWDNEDFHKVDIIPIIPLDFLLPAIGKVDLVKIDIEGMEYRAFTGGRKLLAEHRPVVFMEYSPIFQQDGSGVDGKELLKIFVDLDYKIEILHRNRPAEEVSGQSGSETIQHVDGAWEEHVKRDKGTHLDLRLYHAGK
jgi:FkbM family methyltransferase